MKAQAFPFPTMYNNLWWVPKNVSQISLQTQLGQPILADFASSKISYFFFASDLDETWHAPRGHQIHWQLSYSLFWCKPHRASYMAEKAEMREKCHIFYQITYACQHYWNFFGWFWKPKPSPFHWCMTSYDTPLKRKQYFASNTGGSAHFGWFRVVKNFIFFLARILMKLGMHLGVIKYIDSYLIHLFDASHTEWAAGPIKAKMLEKRLLKNQLCFLAFWAIWSLITRD